MKQFLFIVALLGTGIQASSNPFDLQENLQKIDQDQDVLLSALKEMAEEREAQLEAEEVKEEQLETVESTVSPAELIKDLVVEEEKTVPEDKPKKSLDVADRDNEEGIRESKETVIDEAQALEMAKEKDQLAEEERLQKVKEEQLKIEQARAVQVKAEEERMADLQAQEEAQKLAAQKEAEVAAAQKREQERLEVEAYEAQRVLKKEQEDARIAEAKAAEKKAAEEVKKEEAKHAIVDINITREESLAKEEADSAYLEAIKEVE